MVKRVSCLTINNLTHLITRVLFGKETYNGLQHFEVESVALVPGHPT